VWLRVIKRYGSGRLLYNFQLKRPRKICCANLSNNLVKIEPLTMDIDQRELLSDLIFAKTLAILKILSAKNNSVTGLDTV
jgi:hypothetical protein